MWGMRGSKKSTVVETGFQGEQAEQFAQRKDPQEGTKGSKTESQVGGHDGEQNESILTTAPQNLAECERLVITEFAKSQMLKERAKL